MCQHKHFLMIFLPWMSTHQWLNDLLPLHVFPDWNERLYRKRYKSASASNHKYQALILSILNLKFSVASIVASHWHTKSKVKYRSKTTQASYQEFTYKHLYFEQNSVARNIFISFSRLMQVNMLTNLILCGSAHQQRLPAFNGLSFIQVGMDMVKTEDGNCTRIVLTAK